MSKDIKFELELKTASSLRITGVWGYVRRVIFISSVTLNSTLLFLYSLVK